jgi:hypothetical protein
MHWKQGGKMMNEKNRLRDIAAKYAHLLSVSDYSYLLSQADEVERLADRTVEFQAIIDDLTVQLDDLEYNYGASLMQGMEDE